MYVSVTSLYDAMGTSLTGFLEINIQNLNGILSGEFCVKDANLYDIYDEISKTMHF